MAENSIRGSVRLAVAFMLLASAAFCGASTGDGPGRNVSIMSLSDGWTADGLPVSLPHTWNAVDAADGPGGERDAHRDRRTSLELLESYSRKAVVYRRSLPNPSEGRRQFVKVDAAATVATVKVNGSEVGVHKGAFTAFCYEVTQFMKPSGNELEITVDNRRNVDVAPISGDYSMQGGLYRNVWLIETPQVCIDRTRDGGPGMELDIAMDGHVTARVRVLGGPDETHELYYPNPELWTPENPRLYEARVRIASGDEVSLRFGFRTAEFRPDGFYLNGERRVLKGVNRHQDMEGKGWAMTAEDEERDVALMLEMGADAVRTAHYPQSERMYTLFDEKGLLAWCEVPLLNGVTHSAAFEANLRDQCREMVAQLRHHPSIVMWSIYNELYENFPMPEESAEPLVERFAEWARGVDHTRPQVAASDQVRRARLNAIPHDAVAFNRYPGWYNGPVERTQELLDEIFVANPGRTCCGISEYGGGGSILHHGDPLTRCTEGSMLHTEEYQAYLHSYMYKRMADDGRIWGTFMWVMFDFASDYRTEGDRPGINDKGMMTRDRRHRKDVFWFYKANWSKEPVLHLVGKRMKRVGSNKVNVLVFSSCGPVTLRVNGKTVATQEPDSVKTVLFRDVGLGAGENAIEVCAGERTDRAVWVFNP